MKVKTFVNYAMDQNTYLLENGQYGVIIDPGFINKKLEEYIEINNIKIEAILLTHGHFDHIGACDHYISKYQCSLYISANDSIYLTDGKYNLDSDNLVTTKPLLFENKLKLNHFEFDIIEVPGHSLGSCLICCDNIMFSGDMLFKGSIGRTDFAGSNPQDMLDSIKKIKQINKNYEIYPGHGPKTTLKAELEHNMFMR